MEACKKLISDLQSASRAVRNKRDSELFFAAATALQDMLTEHAETLRIAKEGKEFAVRQARKEAACQGYDAGRQDGIARGLNIALDPMEPEHQPMTDAWRERRANLLKEDLFPCR